MSIYFKLTRYRMKCLVCCICVTLCVGFYSSLLLTCTTESRVPVNPAISVQQRSPDKTPFHEPPTTRPRDHHDYNHYRPGPGENGKGVNKHIVLSDESQRVLNNHTSFHGFDTLISDVVSIHRTIPDLRSDACKSITYPENLPAASVVIIFRDEWPSVLLRTVYSVLGNTPPGLLKEIVLVDDGSIDAELSTKVDLHVANLQNVKLLRNKQPLGLMAARNRGIQNTSSEYFVVMDSHMEVGPGWLEPLVKRLVDTPKVVLSSKVGGINGDTFEYKNDGPALTVFPFFDPLTLDETWVEYSNEFKSRYNGDTVDSVPYGMVQGMMIGMTRGFYRDLGGFDTGMKVWGSEQLELSIKAWMCGGRVEMVPCSKVAHLYRQTPWTRLSDTSVTANVNKGRLVNVWMDRPYTDHLVQVVKMHLHETGNLSDRHAIRKLNKCKPYSHFVDMVQSFSDVYIPKYPTLRGSIVNQHYNSCLDLFPIFDEMKKLNDKVRNVTMTKCDPTCAHQYFLFTENSELRSIQCHTVKNVNDRLGSSNRLEAVQMTSVSRDSSTKWRLGDVSNGFNIVHNSTGMCLTAMSPTEVNLAACHHKSTQVWVSK